MQTDPEPTAERMVFSVPSETMKGQAYRVDLLSFGGASECCCRDWATRRWPAIKAGQPPGTNETMCKHVARARQFFLQDLLAVMAKGEEST